MSALRILILSFFAIFFLTGADHREAPLLSIPPSQAAGNGGEIEILSWSWGETSARQGGAILVQLGDKEGKALLSRLAKERTKLPTVLIETAEGDNVEYYTITMSDVLVSSYQSSGSAGGDTVPMDTFSLNFAKIDYDYTRPKD